jgi:hypothetical protein
MNVELNGVSFGFDLDQPLSATAAAATTTTTTTTATPNNDGNLNELNHRSSTISIQSHEQSTQHSDYQHETQATDPSSQFPCETDERFQQQQRLHPSSVSYIDPHLLLQYNQQRFNMNYSQQLAYINYIRAPYFSQQSPYFFLPNQCSTSMNNDDGHGADKSSADETSHNQEPLIVYTAIPTSTGQIYLHPVTTTKKSYSNVDEPSSMFPTSTFYPSSMYYPTSNAYQHVLPSHTAYFQPIASVQSPVLSPYENRSPTNESEQDEYDDRAIVEDQYVKYHRTRQQASSNIMSNALKLVYSQEKRHMPKDSFNLDQLTAYLAMRWTDTVDRYEHGKSSMKNESSNITRDIYECIIGSVICSSILLDFFL